MLKLSTRSSYGLRACVALALRTGREPLPAIELSRSNQIPHRYLEQILNSLRRQGLVDSTRGTKGGYKLAKDPSTIRIGDIVRAVEGELEPILCSVPEHRSQDCRTHSGCISRGLCHALESTLMRVLDGTTLEDLRREALHIAEHPDYGSDTLPLSLVSLSLQRQTAGVGASQSKEVTQTTTTI